MVRLAYTFVFVCFLTLAQESSRASIVIDNYSDAVNDRFTNNASFIASAYDLSGIGQANSGRWATAISSNVVISANHFEPGGTVSFYPGNDPSVTPESRSIAGSTRVASSDLWLAVLDAPLSSSIATYEFAAEFLSGALDTVEAAGSFQGDIALLVGRSPKSNPAFQDQAFGQNRISGYQENVSVNGPDTDALLLVQDAPGDADFVSSEAFVQVGDSGAPAFVVSGGELLLLGTNSFNFGPPPDGSPSGSGVNYVGNHAAFISDYINANAVPEPNCLAVLACLGGVLLRTRSRRV